VPPCTVYNDQFAVVTFVSGGLVDLCVVDERRILQTLSDNIANLVNCHWSHEVFHHHLYGSVISIIIIINLITLTINSAAAVGHSIASVRQLEAGSARSVS